MEDIAIILYTHSSYSDAWPLFFGQMAPYFDNFKKYAFLDKYDSRIPDDYQQIHYNDSDLYPIRFANCLKQVSEKYCIFHHEDMFLLKDPKLDRICEYPEILEKEGYDFVRLIKGGRMLDTPLGNHYDLKIVPNTAKYIFVIQPSLWKTKKLMKVYSEAGGKNIWEFEMKAQPYCKRKRIQGLYCYMGESQRGKLHWNSDIYPYIATAIVKGKWNVSEYKEELEGLFQKYQIDPTIRGFI